MLIHPSIIKSSFISSLQFASLDYVTEAAMTEESNFEPLFYFFILIVMLSILAVGRRSGI